MSFNYPPPPLSSYSDEGWFGAPQTQALQNTAYSAGYPYQLPASSATQLQPPPPMPFSSPFSTAGFSDMPPAGEGPSARTFSLKEAFGVGNTDGLEPPLLQELGVNMQHIVQKSLAALIPLRTMGPHLMDDADLAGPVFFCLLLGACLLLSGKIQFGYIYGISTLGWMSMYLLINLMAEEGKGIDGARTASVLGYSLLPMILLALLGIFFECGAFGVSKAATATGSLPFALSLGSGLSCVAWCTFAATNIFVAILDMKEQRFLIAFPLGLLYSCFALLTVF